MSKSPTYSAWSSMKTRCDNPWAVNYEAYGGRGITYEPRWAMFNNFLLDLGERPEGKSLDRIDNNGNYCKENCRWATAKEQANNRRFQTKGANNKSGIQGVSFNKQNRYWTTYGQHKGIRQLLYSGKDFFEACCARKSWENARQS